MIKQKDVRKILEIGILLSEERSYNRMLEKILKYAMDLANCDAGTLYLRDGDTLRVKILRNNTAKTYFGGDGIDPELPPVSLHEENVCAMSFLEKRTIHIDDVKTNSGCDAINGYHIRSMLMVPMCGCRGAVIGVLQLINPMDAKGNASVFSQETSFALESIASQAAVAVQNMSYLKEIKELFNSFVRVMSTAIDARSPYNATHTRHVAACAGYFMDYINQKAIKGGKEEVFGPARREELLMSIWLHDIGKLVTPLGVMDKATKLLPVQRTAFLHRMEKVRLLARIDCLSGSISEEELRERLAKIETAISLVHKVNTIGLLSEEEEEKIRHLSMMTYTEEDGSIQPWITADEYTMLLIRKGTLSDKERKIMKEHVVMTDKFLEQIYFPEDLSHVRQWASSHHEFLDGSGYPKGLKAEEIPYDVRMITILDIFDALVADDRPYKAGMPLESALSILKSMAEGEGKLDRELVELFVESKCWENVGYEFI